MEKDNDFARKAFADATAAESDREFDAFCKAMERNTVERATVAAAMFLGIGKVEQMCKALAEANLLDFFADYTTKFYTVAFHDGYTAHKEEV